MAQRYLRQIGTKKAPFPWSARKAARRDMVEYDPEQAKTRVEALRRKLDDLEKEPIETDMTDQAITEAMEIAELENKIKLAEDRKAGIIPEDVPKDKTAEELDVEERQAIIDKDADVIKIKGMKTEKEIRDYMEAEHGTKSRIKDIESLREMAISLRTEVIFEAK